MHLQIKKDAHSETLVANGTAGDTALLPSLWDAWQINCVPQRQRQNVLCSRNPQNLASLGVEGDTRIGTWMALGSLSRKILNFFH